MAAPSLFPLEIIEQYIPRFKTPPMPHQVQGTRLAVSLEDCALFDEMGVGKSKQVIDAACILYDMGLVDTVCVICPAMARITWAHPTLGEVAAHAWVPSLVCDFTPRMPIAPRESGRLVWLVVSYELARSEAYEKMLDYELAGRKLMMVADEASYIKNRKAQQTKVAVKLKQKHAQRGVLLDGTPLSNRNILDLYSKFAFLDKDILGFDNYYVFARHHAVMGGYMNKQVLEYHYVDELNAKINPYLLRREKKDVLPDLPPKRYTVLSSKMSPETWQAYKQMRDDMLVTLADERSWAQHGTTKQIRLAQITSGFIGGIERQELPDELDVVEQMQPRQVREFQGEKVKAMLAFLEEVREETGYVRFVIWSRFRLEIQRVVEALCEARYPVHEIIGGQNKRVRDAAVAEFQAGRYDEDFVLVGQPQAGGMSLNLTTCHRVLYMSNDFNLISRQQSEDRVHRKGQRFECQYWDMLATGPKGQQTIDHHILKSLREMRDVASWTTDQWRRALLEE